jgi:hypothetical protein
MRESWAEGGRDDEDSMMVAVAVDELVIKKETRSATTVATEFDVVEAAVEVVAVGEESGWRVVAEAFAVVAAVAATFAVDFAAAVGFCTS